MQGSESPKQHGLYVWKELISAYVNAQHIAIVAHSYGGIVVMHLVCLFCYCILKASSTAIFLTVCRFPLKICYCFWLPFLFCIGLSRYIATATLAITAVFLEYLRQFLIDLHQIYRHSSVPKNTSPCIFSAS